MSSSILNKSIELIRAGDKATAQRLLKSLVESGPNNIAAWFWYADTFQTDQERLNTLQLCLARNPDNPQVKQALSSLMAQQSPKQQSVSTNRAPLPATQISDSATNTSDRPDKLKAIISAQPKLSPVSGADSWRKQASSTRPNAERVVQAVTSSERPEEHPPQPAVSSPFSETKLAPARAKSKRSKIPIIIFLTGLIALITSVVVFVVYPAITRQYLTSLDLEPLLIQSGDLPAGLSSGQITSYTGNQIDELWSSDIGVPKPLSITAQDINGLDASGSVMVMLFGDNSAIDGMTNLVSNNGGDPIEVGDKGFGSARTVDTIFDDIKQDVTSVIFARCKAVVLIRVNDYYGLSGMASYARRLDKRLASLVCR